MNEANEALITTELDYLTHENEALRRKILDHKDMYIFPGCPDFSEKWLNDYLLARRRLQQRIGVLAKEVANDIVEMISKKGSVDFHTIEEMQEILSIMRYIEISDSVDILENITDINISRLNRFMRGYFEGLQRTADELRYSRDDYRKVDVDKLKRKVGVIRQRSKREDSNFTHINLKSLREALWRFRNRRKLNLATESDLYNRVKDVCFRREFPKTQGDYPSILLGRLQEYDFEGRVFIRTMELLPLVLWMRAFEAADLWENLGFDYVPVEPIIRVVNPNRALLDRISIFTRVIPGKPLPKIESLLSQEDRVDINNQKKVIEKGLRALNINHGHLHDLNFLAYFPKGRRGKPDLSQPPRVYIIDFDIARPFSA